MLLAKLRLERIATGFARYYAQLLTFTLILTVLALWSSAYYLIAGRITASTATATIKYSERSDRHEIFEDNQTR